MPGIYDDAHARGGMTADWWARDPKRMAFVAARYKHVGRILNGYHRVLEIGCADGFFSRIVRQHVGSLVAVDCDALSIQEAQNSQTPEWPIEFRVGNIIDGPMLNFDAAYALDVLEHVGPESEHQFLENLSLSAPVCVLGSPSLESQGYASELSRLGHVNCMTEGEMRMVLSSFWKHVFIFGMNDETLHTGFGPMCHYRLALCVN